MFKLFNRLKLLSLVIKKVKTVCITDKFLLFEKKIVFTTHKTILSHVKRVFTLIFLGV